MYRQLVERLRRSLVGRAPASRGASAQTPGASAPTRGLDAVPASKGDRPRPPRSWAHNTWEEKARENPLFACAGIDIAPTMLRHCRRLVPEVESLHLVDDDNRSDLPDACATVVYSYAVLQHIRSLRLHNAAILEMCRLLRPGGILAIQVNCEDFVAGFDARGRTENFEDYSLHYRYGESQPYLKKLNDNWSGVYIGFDLLTATLAAGGVDLLDRYLHNPEKPRALWVVGQKRTSAPTSAGARP